MKWSLQGQESRLRVPVPCCALSSHQGGGKGVTIEWYQSLGLGGYRKTIRLKMYLHSIVLA